VGGQPAVERKAVVFTHFGSLNRISNADLRDNWTAYSKRCADVLRSYLDCGEYVGLVYVYVDAAIRQQLPRMVKNNFSLDAEAILHENSLFCLLKEAEEVARGQSRQGAPPRFEYVGIQQLLRLLNNLMKIDERLLRFLSAPRGKRFTYDAPKFPEAVIRLARGDTPHLADNPILRIDEDAGPPTPPFIRDLLTRYAKERKAGPFFFFSGKYSSWRYDPINDHAVRVHWLADVPQNKRPKLNKDQQRQARTFLADLNELGATQISNSRRYYSKALKQLLSTGKRPSRNPARGLQAISGAGLIMSRKAVDVFPPFMNFEDFTVWVDDHLKRLLHEMAGHLVPGTEKRERSGESFSECQVNAVIPQDRHRHGLTKADIDWAKSDYFYRLLRGCLFESLITTPDGKPTPYSSLLESIARFAVREVSRDRRERLTEQLSKLAQERYNEVVMCWRTAELEGTPLHQWTCKLKKDGPGRRQQICRELAEEAIRYIDLLVQWPIFTRAIERLEFLDNPWLFTPVR